MSSYTPRLLDPLIADLLTELPALLLVGPRASGKTTTAARHVKSIVRLDREAEAAAFRSDPDSALATFEEPILLDEWQVVPDVLGAVKRAVDSDSRPGRFLLTGSVRGDLDTDNWPGTGRVIRLPLLGMTVREQRKHFGSRAPFLDRLASDEDIESPTESHDLQSYVELALRGGFPQVALGMSKSSAHRWLDAYIDQLVTRDASSLKSERDPDRLRRYFEGYALNSAGVVSENTLLETSSINRKTAVAYEQLLKNLWVVESVPAWTSNRISRLTKSPKRFLVDPSLLTGLLRLDIESVFRDGSLLGRLIETFVTAQLRAELAVCDCRPRMFHLRDQSGRHEVDLIVELGGQKIIGIEIKSTSAPKRSDAKHLEWLRDTMKERFQVGVVFHTGPLVFQLSPKIWAVPICALWS